mmetsp:Transcript_2810/g.3880  ORF Transcript_2810/g.3880 Transcript_2810/m.3880 type:complete len:87 (+) Transcript_2810:500-760(+)
MQQQDSATDSTTNQWNTFLPRHVLQRPETNAQYAPPVPAQSKTPAIQPLASTSNDDAPQRPSSLDQQHQQRIVPGKSKSLPRSAKC